MRHTLPVVVLFLIAGCSGLSLPQRYKLASNQYAAVLEEITLQSQLGLHSLESLERVNQLRQVAGPAFDQVELTVLEGQQMGWTFDPTLRTVERVVDELIRIQLAASQHERTAGVLP